MKAGQTWAPSFDSEENEWVLILIDPRANEFNDEIVIRARDVLDLNNQWNMEESAFRAEYPYLVSEAHV